MKKFSKILCAVLFVALIVSTVAVIVSADTPTPTMTVTPTTNASADVAAMLEVTKSLADGNLASSLAWVASQGSSNPNDLMSSYIVDTGSDKFVGLYAPATKSGIHMQYTMTVPESGMTPITNQHFYVIELDLTTQSTLPDGAAIAIVNRNSEGKGTDMMGVAVQLSKFVGNISAGEWKHVTIIGQIDLVLGEDDKPIEAESINHQYIFVDGAYVDTQKGAVNYNAVMSGTTPEKYNGTGLYAQGIKVEVSHTSTVNAGDSIMFDNLYRKDMTKAEAEANGLAAIVAAKGDLTAWSGYPESAKSGEKLPAFVKIDGVEYNNAVAAGAILTGADSHNVEFIGENIASLPINSDATVKTNGFNVQYGVVGGATVKETAPGVFEVRTPNVVNSPVTDSTKSSIIPVIKYNAADNLLASISQLRFYSESNPKHFVQQYITTVKGDDKAYVSHVITDNVTITPDNVTDFDYENADNGAAKQIHVHTNYEIGVGNKGGYSIAASGTRTEQYVVYEWDMYTATEMPYGMYIGNTFRNASNQNKSGASLYLDDYHGNADIKSKIPAGEWFHITMVGNLETNAMYFYINNELVYTQVNGIANGIGELNGGGTLWGIRINLYYKTTMKGGTVSHEAGEMFATDNFYGRVFTAETAGNLASYAGAASLAGWDKNVYNASYGAANYPKLAPVAEFDGETSYSLPAIEHALKGRGVHALNLIADLPGVLDVNADVVVKTNGYDFVQGVNFRAPEGTIVTVDGDTVSIDVPFLDNLSYTTFNSATKGSLGLAVSNVAGNIVDAAGTWVPNNAVGSDPLLIFKQAENENGDKYLTVFPSDLVIGGNYDKNPYGYFENYNIKDDSNRMDANSYYVIDIDVYTESEWITGITIAPTIRNVPNTNQGFPFGSPVTISDLLEVGGGWRHITYVGDMGANKAYVFVDGVYVTTLDHAWEVGKGNTPEQGLYATGFRLDLPVGKPIEADQMMGFRGISERVYKTNEAAGDIAAAIAAGNLSGWANNIVGYQGEATAIVEIDGVEYSDVVSASAALATGGTHNVEFLHDFLGEITTSDAATLTAHGYGELKINAKLAQLDDGVYVAQDLVKQGNQYIKLDASNVADYAVPAYWYESADADEATEVIYFPVGSTVSYLTHNIYIPNNFIVNGILYNGGWCDGNLADDVFVTEWPTITADDVTAGTELYYYIHSTEEATDITIKGDMKYNLSLYADFDVNVFVKDANGEYTIDGATYTKYTKGIAANNLASDLTFDIEFVVDGVTYTERVTVNVLDYAETVLNKADVSHQMKRVMIAALDYANEAYAFVSGNTNAQIEAILNNPAYAEYAVEPNTEYGPANEYDLSALISAVQLQLDSNVAFVLKVANGFTGEITISYNDYKDQIWTKTYTVEEGQQYIVLDDLKVYNLDAIFNISGNGISGQYNLGQYIKYLVENNIDADFAEALFTYAKVAQSYKAALAAAQ